ncbi:protein serine/threonine phosphatase 2C [Exidia glandulosa HHB12029]|uniref:protein-serine/threonine phosphatase n=1 Tax=Exidia glandulosa HHB12029 TaxID=1314781 RepID=A0A165P3I5_EXIGL|nr:protein serine/threonine phosphatase 2C [Exidia glandulosa HHB12029]
MGSARAADEVVELAKETDEGDDSRHAFGVSAMQGWRKEMEDENTCILQLGESDRSAAFGVFDGHLGMSLACQHAALVQDERYREKDYAAALRAAFLKTDAELRGEPSPGTTALVALLPTDGQIYVANAGDCRAVLSKQGQAVVLSRDHKVDRNPEKERVLAAGGTLDEAGEYIQNGDRKLSVARALGDYEFKQQRHRGPDDQIVTACPEIAIYNLKGDEEFLVLACDGLWDCLSSQQVISYVRLEIARGVPLAEICESIMDFCLAPEGTYRIGTDNMTIVIVALLAGRTFKGWYEWVKERVDQRIGFSTSAPRRPFDDTECARAREAWKAYVAAKAKAEAEGTDDAASKRKKGRIGGLFK